MLKNGFLLGIFALICTALVAIVFESTKDQIKLQERQQLISTLSQLIPSESFDNEPFKACIRFNVEPSEQEPLSAYIATHQSQATAIAMEAIAPDGYNGKIKLIIGITAQGEILGVRTLSHQETPGLGDKIDLRKSSWVNHFIGRSLTNTSEEQWRVKKDGGDFDQFTGATITPRAYVGAIYRTLNYFDTNKNLLFAQTPNCEANYE